MDLGEAQLRVPAGAEDCCPRRRVSIMTSAQATTVDCIVVGKASVLTHCARPIPTRPSGKERN